MDASIAAALAAIGKGGGEPISVEAIRRPWATATRTTVVTLASGEAVVVQASDDRRGLARRVRVSRALRRADPALPVPEVLAWAADPVTPAVRSFAVTRYVPGATGDALLGDDADAARLGALMGSLAARIAAVEPGALRLPSMWADPDRLVLAARRWLRASVADLDAATSRAVATLVETIPDDRGAHRPVVAHGDLAPVNVVVRDGEIVAILDLERARLAPPLFDAAWWRWIIRHHHPARWAAAGPAFLAAAGIDDDPSTIARLDRLAILQCLEMLAATPRPSPDARRAWASRIAGILEPDRAR